MNVLEKSEEVNFYANVTNSFFANEFLCVQTFEDSSKDEGEKFVYKSIKTINFFPSSSYLSFEIYLKEIKLFTLVFRENGYQFYFLNSLGTLLEKIQFIEFNSISCAIPRDYECHFNIAKYGFCVLGVEDKGRSMEKKLGTILEDLLTSLSLDLSLMCYEVSFVKLKLFLESYLSHQGNNLMVKMAKYGRKGTLLWTVALHLPSRVGFCWALLEDLIPTTDGRFPEVE
ncbi:hypothetical protein M9H77_31159 [Catharanthus roseus]|uniref:Uncharacterized protein n=1 Tax=Catharanthus roseus TaxID=4058 RepID=A0ACC0A1Y1_CATRO|nr:hypothetical protein M9H77_31159 [Catharanthus roseus]